MSGSPPGNLGPSRVGSVHCGWLSFCPRWWFFHCVHDCFGIFLVCRLHLASVRLCSCLHGSGVLHLVLGTVVCLLRRQQILCGVDPDTSTTYIDPTVLSLHWRSSLGTVYHCLVPHFLVCHCCYQALPRTGLPVSPVSLSLRPWRWSVFLALRCQALSFFCSFHCPCGDGAGCFIGSLLSICNDDFVSAWVGGWVKYLGLVYDIRPTSEDVCFDKDWHCGPYSTWTCFRSLLPQRKSCGFLLFCHGLPTLSSPSLVPTERFAKPFLVCKPFSVRKRVAFRPTRLLSSWSLWLQCCNCGSGWFGKKACLWKTLTTTERGSVWYHILLWLLHSASASSSVVLLIWVMGDSCAL